MDRTNLLTYLTTVLPMPAGRAAQIGTYFQAIALRKNDCLLREGQVSQLSLYLEEGCCRSFVHDVDNNDVTTGLFTDGEFANDFISFFRRTPSPETIQALTDCRGWAISYDDVQHCFHTLPEFREFGRMLLINNYARLRERMLSMIQQTAEQRYAHLMATRPALVQHVPIKHMATYLGITDTSLSRIRREYARR